MTAASTGSGSSSVSSRRRSRWTCSRAIGAELAQQYGVRWLPSDFKKREGYKRSIELSKQYGLYRQEYCGCLYSKPVDNGRTEE